ncbi:MAG TPA: anaerobic ribonucleoside-triphosphate reductase activating protein [Mobilitalea sp.]|nr:anaerobic ribonucleoside-triphosphate reductase activating protein [Mobilitalea sp.]
MQIHGFNKTTLLDYPKHLASTVFLGSCNFRCPFCHNASLVTNPASVPLIPTEDVLSYLKKRKGILEGVCITGGEPTLYSELPDFIKELKNLGYLVKLDTNGTNPDMLKALVRNQLIDYIAMDIKNCKEKYRLTSGVRDFPVERVYESVSYLLSSPVEYEFRTTLVREFHSEEDILSIGEWLQGAKAYYLQSFQDSGDIISEGLHSHTKETLLHFVKLLNPYIENVTLRGVD